MVGFLIEHYAGAFPVWLAPEQVRVIPITDSHREYAEKLASRLHGAGIRASADLGPDRMNAKIRQAQLFKVPYMAVVGDQEMQNETVALRMRSGERRDDLPVNEFEQMVEERIKTRASEL